MNNYRRFKMFFFPQQQEEEEEEQQLQEVKSRERRVAYKSSQIRSSTTGERGFLEEKLSTTQDILSTIVSCVRSFVRDSGGIINWPLSFIFTLKGRRSLEGKQEEE